MSRILLVAIGLTALSACDEATTSDNTTQLANPAATFCIEKGGQYEIQDGDNGQTGICTLPDGSKQDAWEFFRAENMAG